MKINYRYVDSPIGNEDVSQLFKYIELQKLSETFIDGDIKKFQIKENSGPTPNEINVAVIHWANVFKMSESMVDRNDYLLVNCYTEAANILTEPFVAELKKYKPSKIFLLVNGHWDKAIFNYDIDYTILYWPFWLKSYSAAIATPTDINYWQLAQAEKITVPKTHHYNLLLGKSRKDRHLLVKKLNDAGLIDKGLVVYKNQHKPHHDFSHYSWNNNFDKVLEQFIDMSTVPDLSKPIAEDHQFLKDRAPSSGIFDQFHSPYGTHVIRNLDHVLPIGITKKTQFTVVSETSVWNKNFHITEKTIKPIVLKHPFVVFSSYKFLDYLKSIGFKTFDPIIDESYDKIEDVEERCNALTMEIKRLVDNNVIAQNIDELDKICQHNFAVFSNLHQYIADCLEKINSAVFNK